MAEFLDKLVPDYLYRKRNLVALVVFTALFAIVFINLYRPFDVEDWCRSLVIEKTHISQDATEFLFIVFSSCLVLLGLVVVAISRIIMCYYGKRHVIHYWEYAVWILAEVAAMSALYTVFTVTLGMQSDIWLAFSSSFYNAVLVLLIPYTLCTIFFAFQDKAQQLKHIAGATGEESKSKGLVTFYDERGEMRLSVKHEDIVMLEAADNYVCVWYISGGEAKKILIRNSLKRFEQQLSDTSIVRCHRSYMVNIDRVRVVRREKDGAVIDFGIEGVCGIPISQTYADSITRWLTRQ